MSVGTESSTEIAGYKKLLTRDAFPLPVLQIGMHRLADLPERGRSKCSPRDFGGGNRKVTIRMRCLIRFTRRAASRRNFNSPPVFAFVAHGEEVCMP